MLLVEHDMDAVFALADRISVLVYGRILASGPPEQCAPIRRWSPPISATRLDEPMLQVDGLAAGYGAGAGAVRRRRSPSVPAKW